MLTSAVICGGALAKPAGAPPGANTFFVEADHASASNSNPGTEASPWATIQFGISQLSPGDTLYVKKRAVAFNVSETVRQGTDYPLNPPIPANSFYPPFVLNGVNGTAEAPIKVAAYPGHEKQVGVFGNKANGPYPSGSLSNDIVTIRSCNHVIVEGFYAYNAGRAGFFIVGKDPALGGSTGITLRNCKTAWSESMGINVTGGVNFNDTNAYTEHDWIKDVLIELNDVTKTNEPDGGGNECISVGNGLDDFIIQDNHIYDSWQYGIDCKLGCDNGILRRNLIHGMQKHGIYIDSSVTYCTNIEIYQNYIHHCRTGIFLAREGASDPTYTANMSNITIYNNIIHDVENYCLVMDQHPGDDGSGTWANIKWMHNTTIRAGLANVQFESGLAAFATGIVRANNIHFGGSVSDGSGSTAHNNITADPLFVHDSDDDSAADWRLQADSVAIGAGSATNSVPTDYNGVTRGNPPDVGAFEFVSGDAFGLITFMGGGDIAKNVSGSPDAERTADQIDRIVADDPNTIVWTAGDNAYNSGTTSEYNTYYDPTWGRHRDRTYPTPGNHDYVTSGAAGYFAYFRAGAQGGNRFPTNSNSDQYYGVDLGANWYMIGLNTEISHGVGSAQYNWFEDELIANAGKHIVVIQHRPRWSSGSVHGSNETGFEDDLWNLAVTHGVVLYLVGHEHVYERFAPQNASGVATAGAPRQFTIGCCGDDLRGFIATPLATSEFRRGDNTSPVANHAVMKFTLTINGYAWHLIDEFGATVDRGYQAI